MKKVIMAFAVLTMLGIAGCGSGLEKEYEAVRREFWGVIAPGEEPGRELEVEMDHFRKLSPEEQKKLIESSKKDVSVLKEAKESK